jgi:hypothetical protein
MQRSMVDLIHLHIDAPENLKLAKALVQVLDS